MVTAMLELVFVLFVVCTVSSVVSEEDLNNTVSLETKLLAQYMENASSFPNTYRESVYRGKLTPACVEHYYRMYVTKQVPVRTYLYFHEAEQVKNARRNNGGDFELDWRIIGGHQVDIRQAPYAVLYGLYCGGTLIAPNWVITAAHCRTEDDFIIAGSTTQFDGIRYPVCAHFLHPKWNMTNRLHFHDFDYQLLLLERPVPVTPTSRPIAIGNVNDIKTGELITISGWGHTQPKQRQMQNVIRQVSVPTIPHAACRALPHKYYQTITPRMFCAGYMETGQKDSCQGDSGGPAVRNNMLVGLVSFGVGCAQPRHPGVYTDIPLARTWIREITGLPL